MPELAVEGGRIDYTVEGPPSAPVLLLSNALGTTRDLWRDQVATLARSFRLVRYDTRGHGASSPSPGEYSIDLLGRDAIALLDAIGADRADVGGLSLGGLTAMWIGLHAPNRVRGLVLANTAARIGTREYWQQRIEEVMTNGLRNVAASGPERWFTPTFRQARPDAVSMFQATLTRSSPDGYASCAAALRDADLRESLYRITAPALVIAGELDPVTPPADADVLCAHLPLATRVDLPVAHLSNVEAAEAFTRAMLDFLTD
jgi:3-oxoadipate enol-lactonase